MDAARFDHETTGARLHRRRKSPNGPLAPAPGDLRRYMSPTLRASLPVLLGLSLFACGQSSSSPGTSQQGTLTIAVPSLGTNVTDPILADPETMTYMRLMYDPIIGVDATTGDLSTSTGVASSWQATNTSLTIDLRHGIAFQNGQALTSADVAYTITRAMSPESLTGYGPQIKDYVVSIATPNAYEVVLKTAPGGAPFLEYLLSNAVSTDGDVVPAKYIEQRGETYFREHPIGSGPYQLTSYSPNSTMTLQAESHNWLIGTPKYKQVVLDVVTSATTLADMVRTGEATAGIVSYNQVAPLVAAGLHEFTKPDTATLYMSLAGQQYPGTPFNDVRVREALNLAIDRRAIANLYGGYLTPLGDDLAVYASDLNCGTLHSWPYDPAEASSLLKEYGQPVAFTFDVQSVTGIDTNSMAEAIAGNWEAAGFHVTIAPVDKTGYASILKNAWKGDTGTVNAVVGIGSPAIRNFIGAELLWHKSLDEDSNSEGLHGGDRPAADPGTHDLSPLISEIESSISAGDIQQAKTLSCGLDTVFTAQVSSIPLFTVSTLVVAQKGITSWNLGKLSEDLNLDALVA